MSDVIHRPPSPRFRARNVSVSTQEGLSHGQA
ncbi:hypothetical protein LOM8899_03414 [Flavimaricola marinus]|uniref:Uncharacterized protein n=1 Tax=Flavimaricola marinus TaxID=1819565 RepID=A0A238LHT9_9RHOB|nr:hypothetical protein LOM8899_03414 [Flavimaricola marinus]